MRRKGTQLGPVAERARIEVMDVLRGFAVVFSRWWLSRHRHGPMEWLWRWLTYGTRPRLRTAVA